MFKSNIPSTAILAKVKADLSYVYTWQENGKFYARAFAKRSIKPVFSFYFKTEKSMLAYVDKWVRGRVESAVAKAERKQKQNQVHSVKVGDVFRDSWGYDQTNIDYYEVVEVKGQYVVVREIAQQRDLEEWSGGKCIPAPGQFIGEPIRKKVLSGNSIKTHSFSWAYLIAPSATINGVNIYDYSHYTTYA